MAERLQPVLSRIDALKRQLYDALTNPRDYASMLGGRIQESGQAAKQLQSQAFADPRQPFKVTNEAALRQLTDMMMAGPLGFAPAGITAYHGSPYLFKQFDPMKVGTGEGAQAYGVGAGYTAEARPVAEGYARVLANRNIANQNRLNPHANAKRLVELAGDPKYAADDIRFVLESNPDNPQKELLSETLRYIESGKYVEPLQTSGYLYKGDIPDEILPNFLDWDKPIKEQSPEIKGALDKIMNTVIKKDVDMVVSSLRKDFPDFDFESINGSNVYQFVVDKFQEDARKLIKKGSDIKDPKLWGQQKATELFQEKGLLGIRYLDEKSRGSYKAQLTYKGQPYSDVIEFPTKRQLDNYIEENKKKGFGVQTFPQTSNFIPFRPEDFKIQEINDIPLEEYIAKGLLSP